MRRIASKLLTITILVATPMASIQAQTREEALSRVVASRSCELPHAYMVNRWGICTGRLLIMDGLRVIVFNVVGC